MEKIVDPERTHLRNPLHIFPRLSKYLVSGKFYKNSFAESAHDLQYLQSI